MKIFSDLDEAEMVGHLYGEDAQAFLDAVSEVSTYTPTFGGTLVTWMQITTFCQPGVG